VLYGSAGGLWEIGNQQWSQGSPGIKGAPEDWDQFGGDYSVDWEWRNHLSFGISAAGS
jgi:hypothetical protein